MVEQRRGQARKKLITESALQIIIERGVHSTTHREIAAVADVPLGSLTYYFSGLTDILVQAFQLLHERMAESFNERLSSVHTQEDAIEAFTDIVCGYPDQDMLHGLLEFYAYGNHNEDALAICKNWLNDTQATLLRHFPKDTTKALDALLEGWHIHQCFTGTPAPREAVLSAVRGIVEQS